MFHFRLDTSTGVPPYLQLVHQVRQALLLGYLQPGDRLPTVKDVVADTGINPNTVAKAYRFLDHEGLVRGMPGVGTFVTDSVTPVAAGDLARLRRKLEAWLSEAAAAGLDDAAIDALFDMVKGAALERRTTA